MRYFKNTSWLFAEKTLRMVASLLVGIWVARYLGPKQFGLLSYAMSFVGLFTTISTLGLDGVVIRELVKDESKRDVLLGTAFSLKFFGAILVLFVLAIAVNFTSNDQYTNMLVFIIASATIFQSFNVIDFYFQSKVLSKYVVFANIISLFISSIIKIALILNEAPLITFAYVVLFDSFVLAVGFLYFYINNNLSLKQWNFDKIVALNLLKESWPLIFSGIVISIYMKIDRIMIKEILDSEAVGLYSMAVRFVEALFFIPLVISQSLSVILFKEKNNIYDVLGKLYVMVNIVSYIVILIFLVISDHFIYLIGNDYIFSITIMNILIVSILLQGLALFRSTFLISINKNTIHFYIQILGVIINITLNYFFIHNFGVVGAAYATVTTYIFTSFLFNLLFHDTRKIFIIQLKSIFLMR